MPKKKMIHEFYEMKSKGQKITFLTAYDYPTAAFAEAVGLDLYQQERATNRILLYRAADYPLSLEDLERLRGRGVHQLFIRHDARDVYQKYLRGIATRDDLQGVPIRARAGASTAICRTAMTRRSSSGRRSRARCSVSLCRAQPCRAGEG